MSSHPDLNDIFDRLAKREQTDSDIQSLRQLLQVREGQNTVQIGKYNVNIAEGRDIHIGDRIYQGVDAKTIREILREILARREREINVDWHRVSQAMLSEQQRLTTNPLTSGEGITYRTEQVYVPLGLVERKKQTRRREDVSPEQGSELYRETEITQTFEHQQFLEQVLRQRQSPKSQGRRIAIIGEPGAGKTTLLQQIAQWVSGKMAQSVAIWVSLTDLQGRELESYLLEVWLPAVARKVGQAEASTQVQNDFVAQFNQGLVWLLLDGVDEMQATGSNPLAEIERQIRTGTLLQQARIVLSCRLNLWDGGSNALDSFDNYRTLEFSYPQQVEQFIIKWFGSLPSAETQTGQRLCVALRQSGKERIRDLVKNPLRLTLLCFNWYLGEGKLPETKAGLYEQFVADFYEWKKGQFATTGEQRRRLNAALGELAREVIDKEATRFRLRQEFVCEYLGEPDDANSLFALALRLGWLNKVGVDADNPRKAVYAFFHPTFQEYFAALAIEDWDYFMPRTHKNKPIAGRQYRIFEAHWKEVILLWMGIEEKNNTQIDKLKLQKQRFVIALNQFEDNCHSFYSWQALFLMAECLSQVPNIADFPELNQILEYLVELGFSSFLSRRILSPIAEAAKNTLYNTERELTIRELIAFIQSTEYLRELEAGCKYLGIIGRGNQEAISNLIEFMSYAKDYWHLKAFLECMREIGVNNTIASTALEDFLGHTQNAEAISLTAHVLRYIQPGNQKAAEALANIQTSLLLRLLENQGVKDVDKNEILKSSTEYYLLSEEEQMRRLMSKSRQDSNDTKELSDLIDTIEFNNEFSNKFNAAHELIMTAFNNLEVITSLEQLLERTKNEFTTLATAYCLGRLVPDSPKAISSLCQLLNSSENPFLHKYAAAILGEICQGNELAITSLTNLLNSAHPRKGFYEDILEESADSLTIILKNEQFIAILSNLKGEFLKETTKNCFERYEAYYKVIFHCAQNFPYPKFYQAWHG